MKILIWGAGGIGGFYGSKLQSAGHEVVYVARGIHLEALQNTGLTIHHPDYHFSDSVNAVCQNQLQRQYRCNDFDLIILSVKSTATASFVSDMGGWLSETNTPILSLQNGVDNERLLSEIVGEQRVLGGLAVRIGGHILEPGIIEAKGIAQVIFGQWQSNSHKKINNDNLLKKLLLIFNQADIDAFLSPDIRRELWRKLIINNGVNPLSVLTETDTRHLTSDPVLKRSVYKMMEETVLAAACDGVVLNQSDVEEMFELISTFDAIKTSMLVDYEKGRHVEVEAICDAVIERCHSINADCSVTELVSTLVKLKVSSK